MNEIPRNNIKAIVFDWDGVIVDSMPMIALGIQETAASYGVNVSVDDVLAKYIQPKEEFYKRIGIEIRDMAELTARHLSNLNKYSSYPRLFNDVISTLNQLKGRGSKFGVASNQEMSDVQNDIDTRGLREYFIAKYVLGGHRGKSEKLAELTVQFGLSSNELLFVGDLPSDIMSAKDAGVKSAAIARHSPMGLASAPVDGQAARLKALNPDYFLDSLTDLLKVV
jgi:pyrophosphatase PpaX